jgi:hypothetical protein
MSSVVRKGAALFRHQINLLLWVYFLIGLIYIIIPPILEKPDEPQHFGMIDYLHQNHALPVQDPDNRHTAYHQEGSQPPLYYMLSALIVSPLDLSNFSDISEVNPHAKIGTPHVDDNRNMILPNATPLEGAVLAIYLLRFISLIFGGVVILTVYRTAKLIAGQRIGLFSAGITAFNPMFLFIMSAVSNDPLVTMLNSIALYLIVLLLKEGFNTRRDVLLAVIIALATLTKLSGLALVPVAAITGLYVSYQRRDIRGLVTLGGAMLGIWLALAGWWYLRNIQLYGELFGTSTMVQMMGARPETFTFQTLIAEFEGFRISYWGNFGWVNILTPPLFYQVMDGLVLLATLGIIWVFFQRRHHNQQILPLMILGLTLLIGSISLINWTAQTHASQGRLLFPYIVANSILLAIGINVFIRAQWLQHILIIVFAGFAIVTPMLWIMPHYEPLPPIEQLPDDVLTLDAQYGDIRLIGYEYENQRYESGDKLTLTLYWQPVQTSAIDYSLYLNVLDQTLGGVIGKVDTYPAGGLRRTSTWEADLIYPDTYHIPLTGDGAFDIKVLVGWWDYETKTRIDVTNQAGDNIPSVLLEAGGYYHQPALELEEESVLTTFGDVIELIDYQLASNGLTLTWHAKDTPDDDYTVFVHVLDLENGQVIGQADAPPVLSTQYWRDGDIHQTDHYLRFDDLPAPPHHIIIGWYRGGDFWRLPTDTNGDAFILID